MQAKTHFFARHRVLMALSLAVCLALLSVPVLAAELAGQDGTTTASVSFIEGDLEFPGSVGGSGMYFQFGQHVIPINAVSYPAENTEDGSAVSHVLPVEDSRFSSGDWHVTVSMTPFTDSIIAPTSTFNAVIRLLNPVVANQNAIAGTAGLTVVADISILSAGTDILVMSADDTLPRGMFTATWTNDKATLNIGAGEVGSIQPLDYSATLTWTLNQGPF